jgi:hypothetical protein
VVLPHGNLAWRSVVQASRHSLEAWRLSGVAGATSLQVKMARLEEQVEMASLAGAGAMRELVVGPDRLPMALLLKTNLALEPLVEPVEQVATAT